MDVRICMDIPLDVSKHCVLSAAKRAYSQAVNQALRDSDSDSELEAKIEILKTALETMDLAGLRGKYPELAGGSDADVRLQSDEQGRISLLLQGRTLTSVPE
jgi:hypothetical protein